MLSLRQCDYCGNIFEGKEDACAVCQELAIAEHELAMCVDYLDNLDAGDDYAHIEFDEQQIETYAAVMAGI